MAWNLEEFECNPVQALMIKRIAQCVEQAFTQANIFVGTEAEIPPCQTILVLVAVAEYLDNLAKMAEEDTESYSQELSERAAYAKSLVKGVITELNSKNMHI